jgi:hypothetical protein
MMMSIICMLLAVGGMVRCHLYVRECAYFDLHQEREDSLIEDSLIVSYLPPDGYFFEMEARAPL